jgi:plastocyanin
MSRRRLRVGFIVAIVAMVVAAWSGTALAAKSQPAGQEGSQPQPQVYKVTIRAVPILQFDTNMLKVDAGAPATVHFLHQDPYGPHSFSVYTDASATVPLAPGSTGAACNNGCSYDLVFTPPAPGSYYFQCDVHGAAMSGAFVVSAPSPTATPTATVAPTATSPLAVGGVGSLPVVPPGDGGGSGMAVVAGIAVLAALAAVIAGGAWRLAKVRR